MNNRYQLFADQLEHKITSILQANIESNFVNLVVNADSIRKLPFYTVCIGLAPIYKESDENKRKEIDEFINELSNKFYNSESGNFDLKLDDIDEKECEEIINKLDDLLV